MSSSTVNLQLLHCVCTDFSIDCYGVNCQTAVRLPKMCLQVQTYIDVYKFRSIQSEQTTKCTRSHSLTCKQLNIPTVGFKSKRVRGHYRILQHSQIMFFIKSKADKKFKIKRASTIEFYIESSAQYRWKFMSTTISSSVSGVGGM